MQPDLTDGENCKAAIGINIKLKGPNVYRVSSI